MTKRRLTRRDIESIESYQKLLSKWESVPKFARQVHDKPSNKLTIDLKAPPGRETKYIPSKVTSGSSTGKRESLQYTGTKMLGIGQLHKSNCVPIFNQEDAIDVAKMRRN